MFAPLLAERRVRASSLLALSVVAHIAPKGRQTRMGMASIWMAHKLHPFPQRLMLLTSPSSFS
jgi:hypothetical protein